MGEKMKNTAILVLVVAVVGLFGAHSMARSDISDLLVAAENIEEQVVDELIHTKGEPNGLYPPYCCNKCGACDRRHPLLARCECLDLLLKCHSSCQNCVRAPQLIYPPRYRCLDKNFVSYLTCGKKCGGTASKSIIN